MDDRRTPHFHNQPGVPQIRVSHRLKAARCAKPCGVFLGQGLVMDETVLARQPDSVFIKAYRVQVPAFSSNHAGRELSPHANVWQPLPLSAMSWNPPWTLE